MSNVTAYGLPHDEWADACRKTIAAFRAKGVAVRVEQPSILTMTALVNDGYTELPVVMLERERDSWQGHRPDLIEQYRPAADELAWTTRKLGKPGRAWLR